jgi:type I restriction enzyme S subunit
MDDVLPGSLTVNSHGWFREMKSTANAVEPGDILYGRLRPYLNKVAIADTRAAASAEFIVLNARPGIDARYVQFALHARRFVNFATRDTSGDRPRIDFDKISKFEIPVPPTHEQRRIVSRIDELFAEIDEGEAALERARQGLDTWRRALLKAAVTGELTRDWRETNRPAETGTDLLARLRAERGTSNTNRVHGRRGAAGLPLDTSTLPELPQGWTWARLSELGIFGRGKSKHRPRDDPCLYGGDMPFIQTGIAAGANDYIKTFHQTYSELGVAQSCIWPPGTLCITIAANIANTAILPFEACFPDSVVGLVPDCGVDVYFIHMWMQTIQSRLEAYAPATAQKNINLEVLHNVAVPLPSTEEQRQIVNCFRDALEVARDCVETVELGKDRNALRQSILRAAFEGGLVPQDPVDEPASALLARVRSGHLKTVARRSRARLRTEFSQPSLPGVHSPQMDPRVRPAGDD